MLKVLHVYKVFGSATVGGVETFIENLVASSGPGIRHLVLASGPVSSTQVMRYKGAIVVLVKPQIALLSMPLSWRLFTVFWCLSRRVGVLHFHYPFPLQDIMSVLAPKNVGAIVTYHSDIVRQKITGFIYRPLMRWFLNKADTVVCTSQAYLKSSPVLSGLTQVPTIIPLALDITRPTLSEAHLHKWRQQFDGAFLLFLGCHRTYKGLDVLISAAAKTTVPVVIAGEGILTSTLVERKQRLNASNVHFVGNVSEHDKYALLQLSQGLVLPSNQRSEAFGMVLLEAARQSKALISTELATGTSWVNQHGVTGLVVAPNDPSALATALQQIIDQPLKALEFGANARARVEQLFDQKIMADDYRKLYIQAADQGLGTSHEVSSSLFSTPPSKQQSKIKQ